MGSSSKKATFGPCDINIVAPATWTFSEPIIVPEKVGGVMGVTVQNKSAAAALTDFKVQVCFNHQDRKDGIWHDYLDSSDWADLSPEDTTNLNLHWRAARPDTLAAGANTGFTCNVRGAYAVRFGAKMGAYYYAGSLSVEVRVRGNFGMD